MGLLKKVWSAQVRVLTANKLELDDTKKGISIKKHEKREKEANRERKEKPFSISGQYFSSHPKIKGQVMLGLDFTSDGVIVHNAARKSKRQELIRLNWHEVVSYNTESDDLSQINTSSRVTLTRLATLGVFAVAAQKKKDNSRVANKFVDVLVTTTGDIVLETELDSGTMGGDFGKMNRNLVQMQITKRKLIVGQIRRLVGDYATGTLKKSSS